MVSMSIRWPKNLVEFIDKQRGQYMTRNIFILKLVQEHLAERKIDINSNNVGEEGASPTKVSTEPNTNNLKTEDPRTETSEEEVRIAS